MLSDYLIALVITERYLQMNKLQSAIVFANKIKECLEESENPDFLLRIGETIMYRWFAENLNIHQVGDLINEICNYFQEKE